MVSFQQILDLFSSISKLSNEVQPVINDIRNSVTVKTLDGIQFLDTAPANIQDLNKILVDNGFQEIDESLFTSAVLDIEEIISAMQAAFTEDELAKAIEAPISIAPVEDFTSIDLDTADICAPSEIQETPEFSENELIEAACDVAIPVIKPVTEITQVPTLTPQTQDPNGGATFIPFPGDDVFDALANVAANTTESELFPKNAPDCIKKMQELTKNIQSSVSEYTNIKQELQKIQLDYYYASIAQEYYTAFVAGYGEITRLRSINETVDIDKLYGFAQEKSNVQQLLEQSIWSFSNQFDIDIDTGFLGLFQTAPIVEINKDKLPLAGKIKEISDDLQSFINDKDVSDKNASDDIQQYVRQSEQLLQAEFIKTLESVKNISFAFGVNQFIQNESIEEEFRKQAVISEERFTKISTSFNDLKVREEEAQKKIDGINKFISTELANLNCTSPDVPPKTESGENLNFKNVSKNPTVFDYAWWKKFSVFATLVNLVPVHWPIGLVIPAPTGIIRIPFPIVWFPIFVAPTDKLIAVLFIGQCGILPCPYLFLQHFLPIPLGPFESNNPYFAAAIGGSINISRHEPLASTALPTFDLVFGALSAVLENFRSGAAVDISALLAEVNNQLDEVKNSADRYAAITSKDINDILKNANRQAQQTIQSAKITAEEAIKQAIAEGARLIADAKQRYTDTSVLGAVTLTINQDVQNKISEANLLLQEAREVANSINLNARELAQQVKDRASATLKAIIETGKETYKQKLLQIEQLGDQFNDIVDQLNDLIDKIAVPAIDLTSINLSALLASYVITLGSMKSLAADLSPRINQFGFPTELNPQFSASLPMLVDELPVWERLSLLNIPFLFFLWKWCKSAKYVGGFFPESVFGPL